MNKTTQRGSAILMLFIALALFAAISFVFLQGSRNSTSMLTQVQSNASSTKNLTCTNSVNAATKRLQLRGCGTTISYNSDGSNDAAGAPTDGSCSLYHINGGGLKDCGLATCSASQYAALAIGQRCLGVVYVGISGGRRIYTTETDTGSGILWNNGSTSSLSTTATSTSDGLANTNILVGLSNTHSPYAAAVMCRSLGAKWYLPSKDELATFYTNRVAVGNASAGGTIGDAYWSSTQASGRHAYMHLFNGNMVIGAVKEQAMKVRCFRQD